MPTLGSQHQRAELKQVVECLVQSLQRSDLSQEFAIAALQWMQDMVVYATQASLTLPRHLISTNKIHVLRSRLQCRLVWIRASCWSCPASSKHYQL